MKTEIVLFGRLVGRDALVEFKRQYTEAVAAGQEQFDYFGQPVLVSFAKYLLEYAEGQMGVL